MTSNKQPIQPQIEWSKPQSDWEFALRLPVDQADPDGPSVMAQGRIMSSVSESSIAANEHIAMVYGQEEDVAWCEEFAQLLCSFENDGKTLVARRVATEQDYQRLSTPTWIQSEEWPLCCGRSMHFVGQIEAEALCDDPPPGAKLWWHDAASFYVFTCAVCLECKAIGQQF